MGWKQKYLLLRQKNSRLSLFAAAVVVVGLSDSRQHTTVLFRV